MTKEIRKSRTAGIGGLFYQRSPPQIRPAGRRGGSAPRRPDVDAPLTERRRAVGPAPAAQEAARRRAAGGSRRFRRRDRRCDRRRGRIRGARSVPIRAESSRTGRARDRPQRRQRLADRAAVPRRSCPTPSLTAARPSSASSRPETRAPRSPAFTQKSRMSNCTSRRCSTSCQIEYGSPSGMTPRSFGGRPSIALSKLTCASPQSSNFRSCVAQRRIALVAACVGSSAASLRFRGGHSSASRFRSCPARPARMTIGEQIEARTVYIPPHFNEERVDVLHQLIREHGLATLVTYGPSGLIASHVPLVLDTSDSESAACGAFGTLRGHLSRANQQWRDYSPDVPALAIFAGPQHYITPSWYPAKAEHGKVVPTWNYIVVHAYGRLETYDDRESLLANVEALTTHHEANRPDPGRSPTRPRATSTPTQRHHRHLAAHRSPRRQMEDQPEPLAADQASVAAALHEAGTDTSIAMAETMEQIERRRRTRETCPKAASPNCHLTRRAPSPAQTPSRRSAGRRSWRRIR